MHSRLGNPVDTESEESAHEVTLTRRVVEVNSDKSVSGGDLRTLLNRRKTTTDTCPARDHNSGGRRVKVISDLDSPGDVSVVRPTEILAKMGQVGVIKVEKQRIQKTIKLRR